MSARLGLQMRTNGDDVAVTRKMDWIVSAGEEIAGFFVQHRFYIVEYFASFLEVLILFCVAERLQPPRFSGVVQVVLKAALSLAMAGFVLYMNTWEVFSLLYSAVFFICYAFWLLIVCRSRFIQNLSFCLLFSVWIGSMDFLVISIVEVLGGVAGFTRQTITTFSDRRMIYVIFMKVLLLLGYWLFKTFLFKEKREIRLPQKTNLVVIVFSIGCYYCISEWVTALLSEDRQDMQKAVVLAWLFLLLVAAIAVVLLRMYIGEQKQKRQLELVKLRQESLAAQHKALQLQYRENARFFHDCKNHMRTVETLLEKAQYDAAVHYIRQLEAVQTRDNAFFDR